MSRHHYYLVDRRLDINIDDINPLATDGTRKYTVLRNFYFSLGREGVYPDTYTYELRELYEALAG